VQSTDTEPDSLCQPNNRLNDHKISLRKANPNLTDNPRKLIHRLWVCEVDVVGQAERFLKEATETK
jgi:hypothetical protein